MAPKKQFITPHAIFALAPHPRIKRDEAIDEAEFWTVRQRGQSQLKVVAHGLLPLPAG